MSADVTERIESLKEIVESWSRDPERIAAFLRWNNQFHSYSPFNKMMVFAQNPHATRVASYKRWQELGRQVKKGEHGIFIFVPRFGKRIEVDPVTGEEVEHKWTYFRAGKVFDISQTEGEPLPDLDHPVEGTDEAFASLQRRLEEIAALQGITIVERVMDVGHYGHLVRETSEIALNMETSPRQRTMTLIHELAHWFDPMLVEEPDYYIANRAECEWVAEATAWAFAERAGIDSTSISADYLKGYEGQTRFADVVLRVAKIVETMDSRAVTETEPVGSSVTESRELVPA